MTNNTASLDARDLSTVAIINFSDAPEVGLYRGQLLAHGGVEVPCRTVEWLWKITQQKIAIIFDETTRIQTVQETTESFEVFIHANPEMSVRFFYLKWDEAIEESRRFDYLNWSTKEPGIEAVLARFRIINATKVAPHDLPIHVNRALYKSRLPLFLRKGYDIEIATELREINWVEYRPITITKHLPSEMDQALDYSGRTYIYSGEKGNRWAYSVSLEGRIAPCEWSQTIQEDPLALNAKEAFGLYNKKHDRFYRIHSGGGVSETSIEKTRPGKPDHTTVNLFIHNKKLFSLGSDNTLREIEENDSVIAQKYDSSGSWPLPLIAFKTTDEEE